ncbi:MAG: UDP-N-acetylglucosamine diphosphorylase/glucosamine-1-phosphate N-acetyltransferase [Gammaproteobacteria bacterium HGW-Gammaproteobacteria-10]|nr:MAG: UDP-N-acetylglucosamine diphosphorylase/glucosamine-1-phosphate N-acetyltransferase [Gammaproteobacteria bacterium HGW-Gammaproteobacteria-3]PKM36102.1 MAG: UDP-N-acetylglucosamine diphosphorylase/glucosamine-1-phosphate N-acetyltransferase [Gammaproteobacteria bacterium HGW-Gammaproteobacteria-10]
MKLTTIILAAGKGTRMRSDKPKILHCIAGKSLLEHVHSMSSGLGNNDIKIVYGHGGEQVRTNLKHLDAQWIEQTQQLGTGHAVQQVSEFLADDTTVLILYGDVPLLKLKTVQALVENAVDALALLTVTLEEPSGYGRIVRDEHQQVSKIVEQKDATAEQLLIKEVNTGIMAVNGGLLKNWLARLENNNAQKEFYLTDVIAMAVNEGVKVITSQPDNEDEVLGVNDRMQLAHLERVFQAGQARHFMVRGVTLMDPARFDVRGEIEHLGYDIDIDVNVILEGNINIGNHVSIGANTVIRNSVIADHVTILPNSIIEEAEIGQGCRVGPFARLRPEAKLAENVHVGNFVEIKKSTVAEGSKVNHLSYIGDSIIGSRVNIGAGTITCNYDGVNKFQTIIEDDVFIGSNSQLVAPVTIGKNATIGAGSTITQNTPQDQLTLARARQISIATWQRPVKKEK